MEIAKLYATVDADVSEANQALQGYQRALVESESAALRLERAQDKLNANTDPGKQRELANAVDRAKLAFDQAAGKADRLQNEIAQLNTAPSTLDRISSSASKVNSALGSIGLGVSLAGLGAMAVSTASDMLQLGFAAEKNSIAFETMLGSTAAAQNHLNTLRDFAAATPFEFTDLVEGSKKMQAFGFEAEQVVPMLTNIGDAVAGLGTGAAGIDQVTRALGQMQAKQKAQAGEMLQLTEAGIPAWGYLADAMGLTTAEVMKLSEKGLIPAEQAIDAILAGMEKDFGGLMAKQANTAEGALTNLGDALDRVLTNWGTKFNPVIRDFANGMAQAINTSSALTESFERGIITEQELSMIRGKQQYGLITQAEITEFLKQKQDEANLSFTRAAEVTEYYTTATNEAGREAVRFGEATQSMVGPLEETKEQLDANKQAIAGLNTLMAGAVGNELRNYADSQSELRDRAADLKKEIDELEAAQGQQFTTQTSNGLSANELALAQEKLAVAQAKLSETTDPLKQAQLAVEIDKLQGKIAGANTVVSGYIDNSKKIGELKAEYDEVNGALDANAAKHEESMKRIVFSILQQQAAADGFTTQEVAGLMVVAEKWGLVDTATAEATKNMSGSLANLAENGDLEAFEADVDRNLGKLLGWPKNLTTTFNYVVNGSIPNPAAGDINLPGGDNGVYNPTPTQEITPVSGAYAAGGSFVVPGSGSGDRPYSMNLTPGEGVSVTPVSAMPFENGPRVGTVNISVSGVSDPQRAADEVMARLEARGLIAAGRLR